MSKLQLSDLHLHTIESRKSSEVFHWNSLESSIIILYRNDIKIFAFTDHDKFNEKIFMDSRNLLKENNIDMNIIPGVEISILNSKGKIGHCIFYFDPDMDDESIKTLSSIINKNVNRMGVDIKKIIKIFNNQKINFSIIAHGGKTHCLTIDDLLIIKDYLYAIEVNENHINTKNISNNDELKGIKRVLYSDTHIWNNYINPNELLNYNEFVKFIKEVKNG